MDIAALIARRREKHGLSQTELADLAQTSQGQISRIERGEISPSFAMVEKLFEAMGDQISIDLKEKASAPSKTDKIDLLYNPPIIRKNISGKTSTTRGK